MQAKLLALQAHLLYWSGRLNWVGQMGDTHMQLITEAEQRIAWVQGEFERLELEQREEFKRQVEFEILKADLAMMVSNDAGMPDQGGRYTSQAYLDIQTKMKELLK